MENENYTSYDKTLRKYAKIVDVGNPLEVEMLEQLISRGANVNYTTTLNENILFEVIEDIATFKYFINKNADIARRNNNKETILEAALSDGCSEVVNVCIDKLSEIELKGRELLNITNTLYHGTSCLELEDRKSVFYKILDGSSNDCLEWFVNNTKTKMLSHISIKLLSDWNNKDRFKNINTPSLGHFYENVSLNSIDDFNDNKIFLKFEDDEFNTFKRVLKYFATKEEFFWYLENNYDGIKDKKINFNFKDEFVSPIIYIFKSLKDYTYESSKPFFSDAIEKVVFILKNNICKEVLEENIFNSFFEYTDKFFDEVDFTKKTLFGHNMATSMLNALTLLSEMPNKVSNWDNVNSQKFIKNIMYCGNDEKEFIFTRDKALLSFNVLQKEMKELKFCKKVKI